MPRRPILAALVASLFLAFALSACGSSSDGSSTNGAAAGGAQSDQGRGGRGAAFAQLDDKTRTCIEDQGVELPQAPPDGQPAQRPGGGAPPDGQRPPAGQNGGAGFQELRDAMSACGVELPERPGGAPGQGGQAAPQDQTTNPN